MKAIDFTTHAKNWISAWNAHDLERVLAHYAADVELISPFVMKLLDDSEGLLRGKEALRNYFAHAFKTYPALRFEFIRVYSGVRSCVLEYRSVNQLLAAEMMEFDEAGKIRRVLAHYCESSGLPE